MPKMNVRQGDGAGAGGGFRGGKGKPGYPVPDILRYKEEEAVFEDLVAHVVLGLSKKKDAKEFVEAADASGLVKAIKIDGMLGEAESPEQLHKGIQHLEDLKPDEFIAFLKKFQSLPLDGGLEVSEKVDGSARISFGLENNKIWTQSKNGPKRTDASQYEEIPMYRAIKAAHKALQGSAAGIRAWWPKDIAFMVAEVLYTKIPNSIEYGPNVVMIHGVHKLDGSVVSDTEAKKIVEVMTKAVGKKLNDGKDEWLFEYKRIVNPSDVMVDVKEEFSSISQIYDELKKLEPNKLKAVGKGPYKATLDRFKAIQLALKKKLLSQLRKQKSAYGPEGGDVEGLVFRDLESGALTKLVDKDYFTKINKFLWYYRELLDKGVKVGDKWEVGIMQSLRNSIADKVFGSPVAKTPGFVQQLAKFGSAVKTGKMTDEQRVDAVLSEYIKKNNLMQGDFVQGFREELNGAVQAFANLKADWDKKSKKTLTHTVKDDDGKPVKKITMDPLIKQRTGESFDAMADTLAGIGEAVESVWSIRDEQTRKVALLKVFLGSNRLEKLQGQLVGNGSDVNEAADGADGSEFMSPHRAQLKNNNADIVAQFADKLAKRGIRVTKNLKTLGVGSMAAAFDIGDNKVLKVTGDVSDAQAAFSLKGKKLKHVADVYDVFEFPATKNGTRYGIVSDKLTPISGAGRNPLNATGEAKKFNDAMNDTFLHVALEEMGSDDSFKNLYSFMINYLKAEKATVGFEKSKELQDKFVAGSQLLRAYGIPEMIEELNANGIAFKDYHANNIMLKSNGIPAIVDLGYSKTKNGKNPDMLEKKNLKEDLENPAMYKGIVKRHAAELAKRNIKVGKEMGSGANGMVFDIGGNKVLKVTIDEDEANSSHHVMGKKLKHVAHIYDVFQFKTHPNNEGDFFGIVQEKVAPLPPQQKTEIETALAEMDKMAGIAWIGLDWKSELMKAQRVVQDKAAFKRVYDVLAKNGVFDVLGELEENDVDWMDMSGDNLMRRGNDLVAIDLGTSESPGSAPPAIESTIIESILEALSEGKADKVGVTIGRFQPFHRGHAEMIRDLAKRYNKVVVIVAGNSKDKKNPFSYETRLDLMKRSMPDVMSKVEVHKAQFGGKGSGYIPGILSELINNASSSVDKDTAVTILVGADRFPEIQKQLDHARGLKTNGTELSFDPDMAIVEQLPDVKNDDDVDRISGTRVREALAADDRKSVEKMMDPHLVSNPTDFEELYAKLKEELAAGKPTKKIGKVVEDVITELITDVGGADGITAIVQANADKLKNSKFKIDLANVHPLGSGKEGVAFDIGNGKVLKVTTDADEASTSVLLIGKNLHHVVKIEDVFRFGNTPGTKVPVYGIISEKLAPLSDSEGREYDKRLEDIEQTVGDNKLFLDAVWSGKFEEVIRVIKEAIMKEIIEDSAKSNTRKLVPGDAAFERVFRGKMGYFTEFFTKYKFKEMMDDLASLGIKFADYHQGNVMKRGSEYVINDLGRSESPSSSKPRNLENKIIEAVIDEMSFSGPGGTQAGMKAGSSAWSSQMNTIDPNSHEMWQDQLVNLQQHSTGSIDTDMS